ncbi:hypothetical protein M3Y96_00601500 [Aphelenchoides besseyi]|nr:hypothetical protein M3Y96_00601500 [Aphelenchoides besseyi]
MFGFSTFCLLVVLIISLISSVFAQNCTDTALNCADNVNLCTNRVYEALMTRECQRACGKCSGGNCVDTGNNCENWKKNRFCESPFYDESVKRQFCAATCNLCGGSSGATP